MAFSKALAVVGKKKSPKKKKERRESWQKEEAGEGAAPLGLSELKLVGVVFSSKAALIDR